LHEKLTRETVGAVHCDPAELRLHVGRVALDPPVDATEIALTLALVAGVRVVELDGDQRFDLADAITEVRPEPDSLGNRAAFAESIPAEGPDDAILANG
jgi:hypothetical protein